MKYKLLFVLTIIIVLLLTACTGNEPQNNDIAISVALTQTAAAVVIAPVEETVAAPAVEEATTAPEVAQEPATNPTMEEVAQVPAEDAMQIEFQTGKTIWYTNGDLETGNSSHFVLAGLAGQQVTIWLTPDPAPDGANLYAALSVVSADGQLYSTTPEIYWSAVLSTSQDYFIDVNSLSDSVVYYQIVVQISPTTIDPALGAMYDLIPDSICQDLGATASEALGVDFTVQTRGPFFDAIGGEAGQGCRLLAGGNGTQFTNPQEVVTTLVNSVGLGWSEQPSYAADGPTGSSVGLTRDMGLMLISATWEPVMGAECPADQAISDCNLPPDQIAYSIEIDVAQYKASFSLDGHWVDESTGFTLDLFQDWKNIYGDHTVVAQDGNKIDSLEASINGTLNGQVATVQFQSSFTADTGTAQITYLDVNTIQWTIIDPPDGEYYLPQEATLTR